MPRLLVAACLLLALPTLVAAEEPDVIYKQGIAKLREAQADHSALVPATKLLAQAAALYEAAGDEAKAAEVNSCLYWARKKMTLADTAAVKGDAQISQRLEAVAKPIPVDDAKAMLAKADEFAKTHADDPLLVAIRYFEVGDRFKDSEAIEKSLKAMQEVGAKAKLAEYKPEPTDGRVFVKSEPAGAAIILVTADGGKMDTGKVTPTLVQLPVGKQSLQLTLKGRKAATLAVEVDGKAIAKPDAATLEPLTVPVDIIFEDGWTAFVDGKPAKAVGTGKAETPCTVELPLGKHELGLAKERFVDVRQTVEVAEDGVKATGGLPANSVEIKAKPLKGPGQLLAAQLTNDLNDVAQWSVGSGKWSKTREGKMRGEGDSSTSFQRDLPGTGCISFRMNVISGMRPRIHLDGAGFNLSNEGYQKTLWVYGRPARGNPFPYVNGQDIAVSIDIQDDHFSVSINGKLIAEGAKGKSDRIRLKLQGGDDWSKGTTDFWDFKVPPPKR